jgi:hypothetical protein
MNWRDFLPRVAPLAAAWHWARGDKMPMKHYAAAVQCQWCGHRFVVCVHSARLAAGRAGFTVYCPSNGSKVHVPAEALVAVELCPAGAVIVRSDRA